MKPAIVQTHNRTLKEFYTFIQMSQDDLYRYTQHHIGRLDPAGWRSSLSPATLASCMYSCLRVTQALAPSVIGVAPPLIPLDCCMSYTVSRLSRSLYIYIYIYIYIGYIYIQRYILDEERLPKDRCTSCAASRLANSLYTYLYIYIGYIYRDIYWIKRAVYQLLSNTPPLKTDTRRARSVQDYR